MGREEPPLSGELFEGVGAPIGEGYAGSGHEFFDGARHKDLAWLGYRRDPDTREHGDAAHGRVIILDLTGVYADPHRHPEAVHGVTDGAPAADGGDGTVKDGQGLVPDRIHLFPAMPSKFLADEGDVLRPHTSSQRRSPSARSLSVAPTKSTKNTVVSTRRGAKPGRGSPRTSSDWRGGKSAGRSGMMSWGCVRDEEDP